jgi:TatD DNase family protein
MSERPPVVDSHVHLDDAAFDADRDEVLRAARAAGVQRFVNIGYHPESWHRSRSLQERAPDIDFALGHHPQLADQFDPALAKSLRRAVRELRPVAIGETGLDFARGEPARTQQELAFRAQLEIAAEESLPTIIHQRDASDALIAMLDEWPGLAPIVLHSFDGTRRLADWAIERGCYIGIGGLATKRAAAPLRELLERMPLERLVLETDAPYLAPPGAPRRNTPANLPAIAGILAPLWRLTPEELCRLTSSNAVKLFGFSPDILDGSHDDRHENGRSIVGRNVEPRETV